MNLQDLKDMSSIEVKRYVCIYPGRFQPFSPHHLENYKYLCSIFGTDNVYIVTTNKVENPNSPLNYQQKKLVIQKYGIDSNRIFKVKSPFSPTEVTNFLNINNTVVFLAMGEKDDGRIKFQKSDGSETYIQKLNNNTIIKPFSEHQYVYDLPHIQITIPGYGIMSGTTMRTMILNSSANFIENILGWYDSNIINMIKSSIQKMDEGIKLTECTPTATDVLKPIYLL